MGYRVGPGMEPGTEDAALLTEGSPQEGHRGWETWRKRGTGGSDESRTAARTLQRLKECRGDS